ncbi:MAG TPA: hypothetical protein VGX28_05455 [Frankiaceae bacterium]|jgi:hypothetical protein|nr:hypothetical protein [Frankiaceae bacterium]
MRRIAATAALAAVTVVALPALPASACLRPYPSIEVDRAEIVAGATVRVHDEVHAREDGSLPPCNPVVPSAEPDETPSPEVSASDDPAVGPTPLVTPPVTLPPLVPVAFHAPADPGLLVHVSIVAGRPGDPGYDAAKPRELAVVAPKPAQRWNDELWTFAFEARVTVPGDLRPGVYTLTAWQPSGIYFGDAGIRVVPALAQTGAPTEPLVRIAALSLLAGAGALAAARKVRRP